VEQDGLQLPEPGRRDRQADAATIQGKRLPSRQRLLTDNLTPYSAIPTITVL
jgi:hypothetical protein